MDLGKLNDAQKAPYEGPDRTQQTAGARKPNFKLPKGYEDEQQFLQEMRTLFNEDQEADRLNREAGSEDLKFVIGDQWEDYVRSRRDAGRKPTLTINRLPAFVAQVLGSRRLNETEIRIVPDNGGDTDIAEVREGLIRSIQKLSRAKRAYDNALAGSVMCGIGNFQVCLDDATNDIWARDIKIKPILDHFAVVWDRNLTDPTALDPTLNPASVVDPMRIAVRRPDLAGERRFDRARLVSGEDVEGDVLQRLQATEPL